MKNKARSVHLIGAAAAMLVALSAFGAERFVPRVGGGSTTLELRGEATVVGAPITLRHIARWSSDQPGATDAIADLVISRFDERTRQITIDLQQVKSVLRDAGANLALIRFSGVTSCIVTRSDAPADEAGPLVIATPAIGATSRPVAATVVDKAGRTLEETLLADASERLGVAPDQMQVRFDAQHQGILKLAEPLMQFSIDGRRLRGLGEVKWDVTLIAGQTRQRVSIGAYVRAWQQQVVLSRPVAYRQVIREEDLTVRRTLADSTPDDPLLSKEAVLGQQASRDLAAGTVLTSRMVAALPLVQRGQLVSVTVESGKITVKTVAEAREEGVFGQTIRVRKVGTQEEFNVTVSGPQSGRMVVPGRRR